MMPVGPSGQSLRWQRRQSRHAGQLGRQRAARADTAASADWFNPVATRRSFDACLHTKKAARVKRFFSMTALAAAIAVPSIVSAQSAAIVDVQVVNRTTGVALDTYSHQGRQFVPGRPGDRFALRITNRSPNRVLAVTSVDGVNVVSGETASPDQAGYVLGPYQSFDVVGWRKSTSEVAAFYFTSIADSYAGRSGRPAHVGAIGVAVFRESAPPRRESSAAIAPAPRANSSSAGTADDSAGAPVQEAPATPRQTESESARGDDRARSAESAGNASDSLAQPRRAAPPARQRIGTGHGERESSQVTMVDFRRASRSAAQLINVEYDTYENLAARGVIYSLPHAVVPNPFPAGVRFVPDPRS